MNEQQIKAVLNRVCAITDDGGLDSGREFVYWPPNAGSGELAIVLDGKFSADELEALAWWMRNKAK